MRHHQIAVLGTACLLFVSACDMRDQAPAAPATPAAQPAKAEPAVEAPPAKKDIADPAKLEAGLAEITPRITSQTEAMAPIKAQPDHRLLLHPGDDKNAVLVIDTKGLSSITLAPLVENFASNPNCIGNPEAGVVDFTWSLDDGAPQTLRVDRDYAATIPVDATGHSKLTLTSSSGNKVTWCDWFAIGFSDVTPQAK